MLTACIALGVVGILGGFVAGFVIGGNEVALSARHRIAAACRAQNRAIARVGELESELVFWKDRVATPAVLMLSRPESRP